MEYLKAKEHGGAHPSPIEGRSRTALAPDGMPRLPRPAGWLSFETGTLTTEATLRNLETMISLLQTAAEALGRIDEALLEAMEILQWAWRNSDHQEPPSPELGRLLERRLHTMDEAVRLCRFHGRGLLNGESGVVGWGKDVIFVRGGPHTEDSPPEGYPVRITAPPSRPHMIGGVSLHESWLHAESEIFLAEGERFLRFECTADLTVRAFLTELQRAVRGAGLDLEVGVTRNRRLIVRHSQYGSQFKFKGCSRKTPLLTRRPGRLEWSRRGRDIKGTLAGEPAFGIGRLLIGYLDNPRTSELSVLWPGPTAQEAGDPRVFVKQNGLAFQDREQDEPDARICLPVLYTHQIGRWLETGSAYQALRDVRCGTWDEVSDTLHMVYAVASEIEDWRERTARWIKRYQNRALVYLRRGVPLPGIPAEPGFVSPETEAMAQALRRMVGAEG